MQENFDSHNHAVAPTQHTNKVILCRMRVDAFTQLLSLPDLTEEGKIGIMYLIDVHTQLLREEAAAHLTTE